MVTHSASGILGLRTAVRTPNVRGIVSYESAISAFLQGQIPPIPLLADGVSNIIPAFEFPEEDFQKLAKIPIQFVFGDNIPRDPTPDYWFQDWWRVTRYAHSHLVQAVNARGGRASIFDLPDAGLLGNTHFPFTDRNNQKVAGLMAQFLERNDLARKG